jgi:hypothetical protein
MKPLPSVVIQLHLLPASTDFSFGMKEIRKKVGLQCGETAQNPPSGAGSTMALNSHFIRFSFICLGRDFNSLFGGRETTSMERPAVSANGAHYASPG